MAFQPPAGSMAEKKHNVASSLSVPVARTPRALHAALTISESDASGRLSNWRSVEHSCVSVIESATSLSRDSISSACIGKFS
jgi:hypothetical protein